MKYDFLFPSGFFYIKTLLCFCYVCDMHFAPNHEFAYTPLNIFVVDFLR